MCHFDSKWTKEFPGHKPGCGVFWHEAEKLTTLDGQPRFPCLVKLMIGLSMIPVSNADCERGFLVLRKIHTDQHPTLKQSTIISLMAIEFNSEECCFDSEFSSELLSKCKATTASLNRSTDS